MKNMILPIMVILWVIGISSVSVTLASQDYTSVLITTIITEVIVVGIYFFTFKSLGMVWKIIGGFFTLSALWAIFNAITRLI